MLVAIFWKEILCFYSLATRDPNFILISPSLRFPETSQSSRTHEDEGERISLYPMRLFERSLRDIILKTQDCFFSHFHQPLRI
jgi:hypothetical protein